MHRKKGRKAEIAMRKPPGRNTKKANSRSFKGNGGDVGNVEQTRPGALGHSSRGLKKKGQDFMHRSQFGVLRGTGGRDL